MIDPQSPDWLDKELHPIKNLRCPHCNRKSFEVMVEVIKSTIRSHIDEEVEKAEKKAWSTGYHTGYEAAQAKVDKP